MSTRDGKSEIEIIENFEADEEAMIRALLLLLDADPFTPAEDGDGDDAPCVSDELMF
jgi:hypothetical protein